MNGVRAFASAEVQETLWRDRVEARGGSRDGFGAHGRHIEALMALVSAQRELVRFGDNFAEARFSSTLTLLEKTVEEVVGRCEEAKASARACQLLVDILHRAMELADLHTPRAKEMWSQIAGGKASGSGGGEVKMREEETKSVAGWE